MATAVGLVGTPTTGVPAATTVGEAPPAPGEAGMTRVAMATAGEPGSGGGGASPASGDEEAMGAVTHVATATGWPMAGGICCICVRSAPTTSLVNVYAWSSDQGGGLR